MRDTEEASNGSEKEPSVASTTSTGDEQDKDSSTAKADTASESSRWRIISLVAVLAVIAIVVGLVVGIKQEGSTKATTTPSHAWDDYPLNGEQCTSSGDDDCTVGIRHDLSEYIFFDTVTPSLNLTARTECDCKDLCQIQGFSVALFVLDPDSQRHTCQCFASDDCLLPYPDNIHEKLDPIHGFELPVGSILTWNCSLDVCSDMEFCQVNPNHALCLTNHQMNTRQLGWPSQQGGIAEPVDQTNVDTEYECLEFCSSDHMALYLRYDANPNCQCFEQSTCFIPWGDLPVFSPDFGTVHSRTACAQCDDETEWCDVVPDDILCFNGHHFDISGSSGGGSSGYWDMCGNWYTYEDTGGWPWQPTVGDYLQSAKKTNVSKAEECVTYCLPDNQVAVFLDAGNCFYHEENIMDLDSNCICYDDQVDMCVVPWGDSVGTSWDWSFIPSGTAYTRQDTPMDTCADGRDWCDLVPDHWMCFTKNNYDLDGWPWHPQMESYLQTADQAVVSWEKECIEYCMDYAVAVFLDAPSIMSLDANCLCYEEQPTCLVPWGDHVAWRYDPSGKVFSISGTALDSCTDYDWCDAQPDHWLCATASKTSLGEEGWPWQPEVGDFLHTADQVNVASEQECIEHCMSYHVAVYLTDTAELFNENCLCYDDEQATCLVPWGEQVSRKVRPSGVGFTMSGPPLSACPELTWCDANPDHWMCFTEYDLPLQEYGWPSDLDENGLLPTAANQLVAVSQRACLENCVTYPIAIYLDSPWHDYAEDVNCFCFDEAATCLIPWGAELIRRRSVPHGRLFATTDSNILDCDQGLCSLVECDLTWCEEFPDDNTCP